MLGETLQNRTANHDPGAEHDRPPSSITVSEPWRYRHSEHGTKLVTRVDEPEHTRFNGIIITLLAATAKV